MEFKGIFIVAFLAYCVQIIVAFPRDISIVNTEEIVTVIDPTEEKIRTEQTLDNTQGRLTIFYYALTFPRFCS